MRIDTSIPHVIVLRAGSPASLDAWEGRPFSSGAERGPDPRDHRDTYERVVASEPAGEPLANGPFRRAAAAILRYDIFPPQRIAPVIRREPLAVGDTVGARYHIAPGLDLFFASRVVAVFDAPDADGAWHRAGFTYRTLAGHPELGEETFDVEKDLASGTVRVALRSWSRPGRLLTRLGWPVARAIQVGASRGALDHLGAIANAS